MGDRVETRFIQVLELLYAASYQSPIEKLTTLERALTGLDTLKFLLRVCWETHIFDDRKYAELSEGLIEVGRQVGGWLKGIKTKTSAARAEEKKK